MYIPIGPSKKDLYKIIIGLLLIVYLIFLGMYKPKALVVSNALDLNDSCYNLTNSCSISYGSTTFNGVGKGIIYFDVIGVGAGARPLQDVNVELSNGKTTSCMIGNLQMYSDSNTQYAIQQIECPVEIPSNIYLSKLWLATNYNGVVTLNHSYRMTFYDNDSAAVVNAINSQNYTSLLTNIQNDLYNFKIRTNEQLVDLYTLIENNQSNISNITNNVTNINDNLNDSSIDNSSANDLTNNSAFQDSNGLDNIIKAPLNFIRSLTSTTCTPINLTIPFINADVSLPCMSSVYTKALGTQLINTISLVINGIVLYRFCLVILHIVHNAKNPNKDELEVLDL